VANDWSRRSIAIVAVTIRRQHSTQTVVSESLIYLYGIVPIDAPEPPEELEGIDSGPVRLHSVGRVAAIVGDVSEIGYSDDALNARLDDLAWVGERGVSHERVVDWYAQQGPIIPLSLFSLHRDLRRVEDRVRQEEDAFESLLTRLKGKREWGVKLWRRESEARTGIDRLSPTLTALAAEIDAAPPGKRFLLEKKREGLRADEVRAASRRFALELFGTLRGRAEAAVAATIPAVAGGERVLLLDAAFLIDDERFDEFHRALSERSVSFQGSGFDIEFTGPWPPYSFTSLSDD